MAALLNLLTTENLAYAERARRVSTSSVWSDPGLLFEALEPGLRVHSVHHSYEDNYFLCEHADGAGWSFVHVLAPYRHGRTYRLDEVSGTQVRNELFEAWLTRPTPQSLVALLDDVGGQVNASDLGTDPREEDAKVVMLLRLSGPDGDALRTMAALGRWPTLNMPDIAPAVLNGPIDNITFRTA